MWKCAAPSAGSARASGKAIAREKRVGLSWGFFLTQEVRPPRKQRARRNQENSVSLRLGGGFIVALRTDQGGAGMPDSYCGPIIFMGSPRVEAARNGLCGPLRRLL